MQRQKKIFCLVIDNIKSLAINESCFLNGKKTSKKATRLFCYLFSRVDPYFR